jgi:serine/threonine protein kinase
MTHHSPELRLVPPADTAADPLTGQVLDGRYRVESVIGRGGMGLVYKATHIALGKTVAIKVLKSEVSRNDQVMARFRREAQSASAIGSPNICDVSDFGVVPDGATYFVMEYLDGPSLGAAMAKQRPFPTERTLFITFQLCEALGAAHERGIVHRDLKPDNVILVKRGKRTDLVKVLDFGIAKVAGAVDKKLTHAGQVFGTPHYMSPEQCGGRDVDHRTDIYALGIMIYEMATGQVPFDAEDLMGVLNKQVHEPPVPPHELPAPVNVPPGLEAVIMKALAKSPDARYQSIGELRADLELAFPQSLIGWDDLTGSGAFSYAQGTFPPSASGPVPILVDSRTSPSMRIRADAPTLSPPPAQAARTRIAIGVGALLLLGLASIAIFLATRPAGTTTIHATPLPPIAPSDPAGEGVEEVRTAPSTSSGVPITTVRLTSDPTGARVHRGDADLGDTPLVLDIPPGETWRLSLSHDGYETRTIVASAGRGELLVHLSRAATKVSGAPVRRRGGGPARRPTDQSSTSEASSDSVSPTPPEGDWGARRSDTRDPWAQ